LLLGFFRVPWPSSLVPASCLIQESINQSSFPFPFVSFDFSHALLSACLAYLGLPSASAFFGILPSLFASRLEGLEGGYRVTSRLVYRLSPLVQT